MGQDVQYAALTMPILKISSDNGCPLCIFFLQRTLKALPLAITKLYDLCRANSSILWFKKSIMLLSLDQIQNGRVIKVDNKSYDRDAMIEVARLSLLFISSPCGQSKPTRHTSTNRIDKIDVMSMLLSIKNAVRFDRVAGRLVSMEPPHPRIMKGLD